MEKDNDIIGWALMDYFTRRIEKPLLVSTSKTDTEVYKLSYFFRDFERMPLIEKRAIEAVSGKVLDIGAGTGIHSLELDKRGFNVTAIDNSHYAVEIMSKRGLKKVIHKDFYDYEGDKFDTLILLMNGIGIVKRLSNFDMFFKKCAELLNKGGQILCDSTDLIYLFEEEDGSFVINLNDSYYGELDIQVEYEGKRAKSFPWLYIDFENLKAYADKYGFNAELLLSGEKFDYLAMLTIKE
jgi:SAM-dependent methyltransferase